MIRSNPRSCRPLAAAIRTSIPWKGPSSRTRPSPADRDRDVGGRRRPRGCPRRWPPGSPRGVVPTHRGLRAVGPTIAPRRRAHQPRRRPDVGTRPVRGTVRPPTVQWIPVATPHRRARGAIRPPPSRRTIHRHLTSATAIPGIPHFSPSNVHPPRSRRGTKAAERAVGLDAVARSSSRSAAIASLSVVSAVDGARASRSITRFAGSGRAAGRGCS